MKLTPERIEEVTKLIRAGNYIEVACQAAGIGKTTYYEWLQKGEERPDTIYADFANSIKKARAAAEARNVTIIAKASETTWQAAAWWLERSFPDRWGRRAREDNKQGGGKINININPLPKDRLEKKDE